MNIEQLFRLFILLRPSMSSGVIDIRLAHSAVILSSFGEGSIPMATDPFTLDEATD
jgi:hypothetical protein